jgi:antitoxin ParD1/3/4
LSFTFADWYALGKHSASKGVVTPIALGRNYCYYTSVSSVEKISIALPPEMVAMLREAIDSGEYASASEVVREALRAWKFKKQIEELELEELKRLVKEGSESGPGIDADSIISRLKKKYLDLQTNG